MPKVDSKEQEKWLNKQYTKLIGKYMEYINDYPNKSICTITRMVSKECDKCPLVFEDLANCYYGWGDILK